MSNIDASDKDQLYILKGLLSFSDYADKYLEHMSKDYFVPSIGGAVDCIKRFYIKNGRTPSVGILCDSIFPRVFKNEDEREEVTDTIYEAMDVKFQKEQYFDWLCAETEKFIEMQSIIESLMQATELVQQGKPKEAAALVHQAATIDFNDDLGLDYFEDLQKRLERLKEKVDVIPTGIPTLNKIIGGGWQRQTLNIIGAPTNVGKTMMLCALALNLIRQGYNVLYITLEIRDDLLANRIDANLTDTPIGSLAENVDLLMENVLREREEADREGNPFGQLIIKDYKSEDIRSNQIKALCRELQAKRHFKPDVIIVDSIDYIIPNTKSYSENTYGKLKTASREVRNVMCSFDCVGFSAVQVGRQAFSSSVIELEDTSDSIGIPQTADFMMMVSRTEDMVEENKLCCHVAKNRFGENKKTFFLDVQYDFMRITDSEASGENEIEHKEAKAKAALLKTNKVNNTSGQTSKEKGGEDDRREVAKKTINI